MISQPFIETFCVRGILATSARERALTADGTKRHLAPRGTAAPAGEDDEGPLDTALFNWLFFVRRKQHFELYFSQSFTCAVVVCAFKVKLQKFK